MRLQQGILHVHTRLDSYLCHVYELLFVFTSTASFNPAQTANAMCWFV